MSAEHTATDTMKVAQLDIERIALPEDPPKQNPLYKYSIGSALQAVWGKWPGDEPIGVILAALEDQEDKRNSTNETDKIP